MSCSFYLILKSQVVQDRLRLPKKLPHPCVPSSTFMQCDSPCIRTSSGEINAISTKYVHKLFFGEVLYLLQSFIITDVKLISTSSPWNLIAVRSDVLAAAYAMLNPPSKLVVHNPRCGTSIFQSFDRMKNSMILRNSFTCNLCWGDIVVTARRKHRN